MLSPAQILASLPEEEQEEYLASLSKRAKAALKFDWDFWARPNQLEPEGDWTTWLILAGRGFGKTRTGAEWVRKNVCGSTPLSPAACLSYRPRC
jgi:phage terminase large subunit-like protein